MSKIFWRDTGNFSLCESFAAQRNGDARYALDLVSTTANLCEEKMRLLRYSKRCPACGKISRGINNQTGSSETIPESKGVAGMYIQQGERQR